MQEKTFSIKRTKNKINRFFSVTKLKDAYGNVCLKLLCYNNYDNVTKYQFINYKL